VTARGPAAPARLRQAVAGGGGVAPHVWHDLLRSLSPRNHLAAGTSSQGALPLLLATTLAAHARDSRLLLMDTCNRRPGQEAILPV
jgi:hypothetical protein